MVMISFLKYIYYSKSWNLIIRYEIERFPIELEADLKCVRSEYSAADITSIGVKNTGLNMFVILFKLKQV